MGKHNPKPDKVQLPENGGIGALVYQNAVAQAESGILELMRYLEATNAMAARDTSYREVVKLRAHIEDLQKAIRTGVYRKSHVNTSNQKAPALPASKVPHRRNELHNLILQMGQLIHDNPLRKKHYEKRIGECLEELAYLDLCNTPPITSSGASRNGNQNLKSNAQQSRQVPLQQVQPSRTPLSQGPQGTASLAMQPGCAPRNYNTTSAGDPTPQAYSDRSEEAVQRLYTEHENVPPVVYGAQKYQLEYNDDNGSTARPVYGASRSGGFIPMAVGHYSTVNANRYHATDANVYQRDLHPHQAQPGHYQQTGHHAPQFTYRSVNYDRTRYGLTNTFVPDSRPVLEGNCHSSNIGPVADFHTNDPSFQAPTQPRLMPSNPKRARDGARDVKVAPSQLSGGVPEPTALYMSRTLQIPQTMGEPQHILLIIDLNGTILFRPDRTKATTFVERPFTQLFMDYALENFKVMIWSSAKPANVGKMCDKIFSPVARSQLVDIWGRDRLGLHPSDYDKRVQCYKRLEIVWAEDKIQRSHPRADAGFRWDFSNTVLLDDSRDKARSEPHNLLEVPEFKNDGSVPADSLRHLAEYLHILRYQVNVSSYIRENPFKVPA